MIHKLHYWETVFFAGLFGAIALYPFTFALIPFFLTQPDLLALLTITAITLFLGILFFFEFNKHRQLWWGTAGAITLFLGLFLVSIGAAKTSIHFMVWFLDITFALLTFGYILVRHLFHPLEKNFTRRWPSIVLIGFLFNTIGLFLVLTLTIFPAPLMALIIAALLLVTFL